jgi:hypothetical protein
MAPRPCPLESFVSVCESGKVRSADQTVGYATGHGRLVRSIMSPFCCTRIRR